MFQDYNYQSEYSQHEIANLLNILLRFYLIFYGFKENAKYIYIRFKKKLGEQ